MKNNTIPTDELNQLSKEMLVILYTNLSESFRILSEQNGMIQKQNEQLIHQVEDLKEQLAVLTQHRFGPGLSGTSRQRASYPSTWKPCVSSTKRNAWLRRDCRRRRQWRRSL